MRQHQLSKLEKEGFCNQEKKSWKPVKMKLLMDFQFFFVGTNAIFRSGHSRVSWVITEIQIIFIAKSNHYPTTYVALSCCAT